MSTVSTVNSEVVQDSPKIPSEVYEDISNEIARLGVAYVSLKAFSDIMDQKFGGLTDSRAASDFFCMAMDEVADVARGLSYLIGVEPDIVFK